MTLPPGFILHDAYLDAAAQQAMAADLRAVAEAAPMVHPTTRWGKQMSVKMTSAGRVGWISDRRGYRYEPRHPAAQVVVEEFDDAHASLPPRPLGCGMCSLSLLWRGVSVCAWLWL